MAIEQLHDFIDPIKAPDRKVQEWNHLITPESLCFMWNSYNGNVQAKFTTIVFQTCSFLLAFSFQIAYSE